MPRKSKLQEVVDISGVKDLTKLSPDDTRRMLTLISQRKLDERHVKALITHVPNSLEALTALLKNYAAAAENAGKSQHTAFETVRTEAQATFAVLLVLASGAKSDKARTAIATEVVRAAESHVKLAEVLERMNRSNNSFWKRHGMTIAAFGLLVVGVAITSYASSRSGSDA